MGFADMRIMYSCFFDVIILIEGNQPMAGVANAGLAPDL